ncbi:MAG: hypothetical protein E3J56_09660 [Candidatus Aminicenantes bacterium]|nr:MAG: hypothetical protein E3J56_09660 [Candidatus Aminicenantes bacterium]
MLNDRIPALYLNENIPLRLVHILSFDGIEAIHTVEVGNQGTSDEFQLQYAADQKCILVSHNRRDFRQLHAKWIEEERFHYGILVMDHGEPEYLAERIGRFFEDIYPSLNPSFCVSPPA